MSFRWPELLWAVLLVPLVLLVWMRGERRRTQRAGVFGNPALLPNVVTARPGWRRVLPVILYLLAATVLLLALARPEATAQVPRDQATIMLVMDYSESMLNTDVTPTRIEAAQEAADAFLKEIPERFQVGLVTFAGAPSVEALPTTDKDVIRSALRNAALRRGTVPGRRIRPRNGHSLAGQRTFRPRPPACKNLGRGLAQPRRVVGDPPSRRDPQGTRAGTGHLQVHPARHRCRPPTAD